MRYFKIYCAFFILQFVLTGGGLLAQSQTAIDYYESGVQKINLERDTAGALADFNKSLQLDSTGGVSWFSRGLMYTYMGKYAEAISNYDRAIIQHPKDERLYGSRANTKAMAGDFKGAMEDFTRAMELNPNNVEAYLNLGNLKHNTNDYTGALKDFDKAIKLDPQNPIAYVRRSGTRYFMHDYEGAIQDASISIMLNPDFAEAYYYRAEAERKAGNDTGACADFKAALALGFAPANRAVGLYCK